MPACLKWDRIDEDQSFFISDEDAHEYVSLCEELDMEVTRYEILPVFEKKLIECIKWLNELKLHHNGNN